MPAMSRAKNRPLSTGRAMGPGGGVSRTSATSGKDSVEGATGGRAEMVSATKPRSFRKTAGEPAGRQAEISLTPGSPSWIVCSST